MSTSPETHTVLQMRRIDGGRVCDLKLGMVVLDAGEQHVIADIAHHADGFRTITGTDGHAFRRHYLDDAEYGEFVPAPEVEPQADPELKHCEYCGENVPSLRDLEGHGHGCPGPVEPQWCCPVRPCEHTIDDEEL